MKHNDCKSDSLSPDNRAFRLRSFSRTVGHTISSRQRELVRENAGRNFGEFMSRFSSGLTLEIGFGNGENIIEMARAHPNQGFIGAEPFINAAVKVLDQIVADGAQNLFVHIGDILEIMPEIPRNSIKNALILFPDPWPKKKQKKRRLIDTAFLRLLSEKVSGKILFATDDADYFDAVVAASKEIPLKSEKVERPDWMLKTKYESKAEQAGRRSQFLTISIT